MNDLRVLAALGVGTFVIFVVLFSSILLNAGPPKVTPIWPAEGESIETLTPTFRWEGTANATQVEFWMVADGPAAAIRVHAPERHRFTVPPPEQWCCMKPGLRYRWKVRATDSSIPLAEQDPHWGDWSVEYTFSIRE